MIPKVLESQIENAVIAWARARGIFVSKLQGMGNRSLPDRIFWIPGGKPLLIEFKRPGGKPTVLQAETILRLKNLGYEVHVIDSVEEAKRVILGHSRQ